MNAIRATLPLPPSPETLPSVMDPSVRAKVALGTLPPMKALAAVGVRLLDPGGDISLPLDEPHGLPLTDTAGDARLALENRSWRGISRTIYRDNGTGKGEPAHKAGVLRRVIENKITRGKRAHDLDSKDEGRVR